MPYHYVQLRLIPESPEEKIFRELKEMKLTQKKTNRSQFAKIADVKREIDQLRFEFEELKSALCKYQKIQQEQYNFLDKLD